MYLKYLDENQTSRFELYHVSVEKSSNTFVIDNLKCLNLNTVNECESFQLTSFCSVVN